MKRSGWHNGEVKGEQSVISYLASFEQSDHKSENSEIWSARTCPRFESGDVSPHSKDSWK